MHPRGINYFSPSRVGIRENCEGDIVFTTGEKKIIKSSRLTAHGVYHLQCRVADQEDDTDLLLVGRGTGGG